MSRITLSKQELNRLKNQIDEKQTAARLASGRPSQSVQKAINRMNRQVADGARFGTSKAGREYHTRMMNSMANYSKKSRNEIFGIVMPAGTGKSTLSRRYGVIDIDELISEANHNKIIQVREDCLTDKGNWAEHNKMWHEMVNNTLDLMDFQKPSIVLLHTEETAVSLGICVIGGIHPTRALQSSNVKMRDRVGQQLAFENLSDVQNCVCYTPVICNSQSDVEKAFLQLANTHDIAVGAPAKYVGLATNIHYSSSCPQWLMRGEVPVNINLSNLVKMYHEQKIPKECVDYYVKQLDLPSAYGFGVSENDWCQFYAEVSGSRAAEGKLDTSEVKEANRIFDFANMREQNRANVTIRRLIKGMDIWSHPDAVDIAKHHIGSRNVFVTSILCHWMGIMRDMPIGRKLIELYKVEERSWSRVCKILHNMIRTSDWLFQTPIEESTRQNLMYMDLLIGRPAYTLTTEMGLENRQRKDHMPDHVAYDPASRCWTKAKYLELFEVGLEEAMSRIKTEARPVDISSFRQWWSDRRGWLTKGSLVWNTLKPEQKNYTVAILEDVETCCQLLEDTKVPLELKNRHNKKSLFEVADLISVIHDNPDKFNITRMATKSEAGNKFRVLLPGTLLHYIVFAYVLHIAEEMPQVGSVRINAPEDEHIRYFDRKMGNMLHHLLYDWKDFNSQHSKYEMARVIEKLNEIPGAPTDYHLFVGAIAESFYNMWLETDDGIFELGNGLLSGWRGTSWINGWLNFIYLSIGVMVMHTLYGEDSVAYVDHGGDDVDLAFKESGDMIRMLNVMNMMKFDATKTKQMFGSRSEFFRVTVDHNGAHGSATRAMAGFIAGDFEGNNRADFKARATSVLDQVSKLQRRGLAAGICHVMVMSAMSHWCRIKDGAEWLDLPAGVIHGLREQGGLGIPTAEGMLAELASPIEQEDPNVTFRLPGRLASEDFVKNLSVDMYKYGLEISDRERLTQKIAEGSYDLGFESDHGRWIEYVHNPPKIVSWVKAVVARDIDSLEVAAFDIEVDESVEQMKGLCDKYTEYAAYVTYNDQKITRPDIIRMVTRGALVGEVLDFKGDIYYRRIVPDFWALRLTRVCRTLIQQGRWSLSAAEEKFKDMCWFISTTFNHSI